LYLLQKWWFVVLESTCIDFNPIHWHLFQ
jgi:hypothetical protein